MKKTILILMLVVMQCAWSQERLEPRISINGIYYHLFDDSGEAMVADGNSWDGYLELPSTVAYEGKEYTVTKISWMAFNSCHTLTGITIPSTVCKIDCLLPQQGQPFDGCDHLESITVDGSNQWFCSEDGVLFNRDKTKLICHPAASDRKFYTVPSGVQSIGDGAFGYSKLVSVSIPNTVTNMDRFAFHFCESLEHVMLPDSISVICMNTFQGCSNLKSVKFPKELKKIKEYAFHRCLSLERVSFPDGLEEIEDGAFNSCASLRVADLPASIRKIGGCFYECPLEAVIIRGENSSGVYCNMLNYLNRSATVYVPSAEVAEYKKIFSGTVLPLEKYNAYIAHPYFPEGTKWTEIRLDTLKYDSWYSRVGDEWVPNFETVEYCVKEEYSDMFWDKPFRCVYTNGKEWVDSLTLIIYEGDYNGEEDCVLATVPAFCNGELGVYPGMAYQFKWETGMKLYCQDILGANCDCVPPEGIHDFGFIEEIKEGNFGGVRFLKYADVKGCRIIQGIGVTEWNDGECLFGPVKPYYAKLEAQYEKEYSSRNYRSMLVNFERDGEVLYDVCPDKTSGIASVNDSKPTGYVGSYDLSGRSMSHSSQKGVFIRNGRKVVK